MGDYKSRMSPLDCIYSRSFERETVDALAVVSIIQHCDLRK